MNLLAADDLGVSFGQRQVLHDVSLRVAAGELIGLVGPNGSGKSTLLRALAGLLTYQGSVSLNGAAAKALSQLDRARLLAFLPQSRSIHWPLDAAALVALGRMPHRGQAAAENARDLDICHDAMRRMDVLRFRSRRVLNLSGGEQNRVLIARALAQDTPLLLADEPTAALDPAHQISVMSDFRQIAGGGRGVLVATHELHLAARWCHRIVILHEGRIVACGTPDDVLTPAHLANVYGIKAHIGRDDGGMIVIPLSPSGTP